MASSPTRFLPTELPNSTLVPGQALGLVPPCF